MRAFSVVLPKDVMQRVVAAAFLRLFCALWLLAETIIRRENIVNVVRRGLDNQMLFATKAARLYIYSRKYEMSRWQDVEAHAEEAMAKGYKVQQV
jgi:hypothetical protein